MTKIHLIIGLPGSGKTHYAKTVLGHLPLVDDISDLLQLFPDAEEFVVIDPNFCENLTLNNSKRILCHFYPDAEIKTIYFENDPEKARANVMRRNDGRNVEGTIQRFALIYKPPTDALKIYSE